MLAPRSHCSNDKRGRIHVLPARRCLDVFIFGIGILPVDVSENRSPIKNHPFG